MNISILGCGWLGLPLAAALLKNGHSIKGSTTRRGKIAELRKKGINPFLIRLDPALNCKQCDDFWQADTLVLNIPPGRGKTDTTGFHTTQIKEVISKIRHSPVKQLIFVSSTSVYPKRSGIVNEEDAVAGKATRPSGNALLKAEQLLLDETESFQTTVLRFGGLYGDERHPVFSLSGKSGLPKAKAPVNLIHRDDCIAIISKLIEKPEPGEVFNAVSDGHPPRGMFYREMAEKLGIAPPVFAPDSDSDYKVVSNRKLKRRLSYRFIHPNPMSFSGPS